MSEHEANDWVYQLYLSDPSVARMTEAAVRAALTDFPLVPVWTYSRLATGVQWALHTGLRYANSKADHKGNAEVRDELEALAERTRQLWLALQEISTEADTAMWNYGFKTWLQRPEAERSALMGEPAELERFRALRNEMSWFGHFLQDVTANVGAKVQPPKWRDSERADARVWLARHLATVFEQAFGARAISASGGSNNDPSSYGPWPDFFCRILRQAGVPSAGSNLGVVMKQARQLHLSEPVSFDPKMIPE